MFGFKRKKSSFSSERVNVGSSRPVFLKPTSKELGEIKQGGRLSDTPHGKIPKKKKQKPRNYFAEASDTLDFRAPHERKQSIQHINTVSQDTPSVFLDVLGERRIAPRSGKTKRSAPRYDPVGLGLVSDDFGLL